ncbi:MAG: hypothetical protein QGI51_04575 [Dehalococcoidales bacterium]|jgi:hypothetical protein|nr:hypothetical protein [Dehalococcoidales bacterium]|tara:strand:+ start:147 stop:650 length:504 start_codon:yes stop_codon:yes gene_type:complete
MGTEEVIAIIDRIIEEHKTLSQRLQDFEQVPNGAEALTGFAKASELFAPGRFEEGEGLKAFKQLLDTITEGIHAHFGRVEGALVTAVEQHGDRETSSTLHSLLVKHKELNDRLAHSNDDVAKLLDGGLSSQIWHAYTQDMRAYVVHTRQLFETHMASESGIVAHVAQ